MRLIVTGAQGQVARALAERGPAAGVEIVCVARPDLDLAKPESVAPALGDAAGDAIVNAAAYTAVDKAESDEAAALAVNRDGAEAVARVARSRGLPLLHLSTDYVFDGRLKRPYREDDEVRPASAYGRSKLAGERAAMAANERTIVLRTSWVYSPFGSNFVKTMLRLAKTRDEIGVVADQRGAPTSAFDIADALIVVARAAIAGGDRHKGVFHMTGAGEATWADFAAAIFEESARLGGPTARIRPIGTADYPTPAKRPANSRLSNAKFIKTFGHELPEWRGSLKACVARLLAGERE